MFFTSHISKFIASPFQNFQPLYSSCFQYVLNVFLSFFRFVTVVNIIITVFRIISLSFRCLCSWLRWHFFNRCDRIGITHCDIFIILITFVFPIILIIFCLIFFVRFNNSLPIRYTMIINNSLMIWLQLLFAKFSDCVSYRFIFVFQIFFTQNPFFFDFVEFILYNISRGNKFCCNFLFGIHSFF